MSREMYKIHFQLVFISESVIPYGTVPLEHLASKLYVIDCTHVFLMNSLA